MKINKSKFITYTKYWTINLDKRKKTQSSFLILIQKLINKFILNILGLELRSNSVSQRLEQISYTKDTNILKLRDNKIAKFLLEFGVIHNINFNEYKLRKNLIKFDQIFREEKITDLNGGMGYNNGLFLFILLSHFQPKNVIESGVWRGFTTYLIDKAIPKTGKIFCFDINLNKVEFKSKKASYFENDLSFIDSINYSKVDFAFFDDHVSIYDRLKFCVHNKIKTVVVDDDVNINQVHGDGWPPIPTASMVYDYDQIPKKFSWITNGLYASANIADLEVGDIQEFYRYIPFPKLGELTGYIDTSFTSLLISKNVLD